MPRSLHPTVAAVTARIRQRSAVTRAAYLAEVDAAAGKKISREGLACSNFAHVFAASEPRDRIVIRAAQQPNIGIVSAYNDMLSAHQPFVAYPEQIRAAAREVGAVAQFAGGVPAMCDGVTQGQPGMELSLFSRDVIAQATAVALSHNVFDAALLLGVCDKIVPGLLIGALAFGHLPMIFVPAGPMTSGLANGEKARVRQLYAEGKIGRAELLDAEAASYHDAGTCTFYGTANSNQMLMEVMGLHLPGAAFVNPGTSLRAALTRAATHRAAAIVASGNDYRPIGQVVDERAIVNGIVGLLATGGSTNHTIHLVAIARAAGVIVDWSDFDALSAVVPTLTRIYPNGQADVNHFHAAGGMGFVIRELLDNGRLHADVLTVAGEGLDAYSEEPQLGESGLVWRPAPAVTLDPAVLRGAADPFLADGGIKLLSGNLGRGIFKTSAVKPEHQRVSAPALVFESQEDMLAAFQAGKLERDCVVVVRFQGPRANGMPELHKLTPSLGVLQDRGFHVALVTDGRMSGASGKVPAAIHVWPESANGGALTRVQDGDLITVDALNGSLDWAVSEQEAAQRTPAKAPPPPQDALSGGRHLFAAMRQAARSAELGAVTWEGEA